MAVPDKHPYVMAPSHVDRVIQQFRKSFPSSVTSDTLKKLSIAPNNESYLLSLLRHLGLIDAENGRTAKAAEVLALHNEADFAQAFGGLVSEAYKDLFDLHGPSAWDLDTDSLISFFRSSDKTSDSVGKLQATTFQRLAILAGHVDAMGRTAVQRPQAPKPRLKVANARASVPPGEQPPTGVEQKTKTGRRDCALTVRIEINLPANGDQDTYDRIFRSIREYLLDV